MEIHNRVGHPQVNNARQSAEKTVREEKKTSVESTPSGPSSVAAAVLQELKELPEVRDELVAQARQSVDSGEFLTLDAARATASALLNVG